MKRGLPDASNFIEETIYAAAHCETWLEDYSKSHNLPWNELTASVANFLLAQAGRTLLGVTNHLSTVRHKTAKRSKAVAKMAMDDRTHPPVQRVKKHWTQKPSNRKRVLKHLKRMRQLKLHLVA